MPFRKQRGELSTMSKRELAIRIYPQEGTVCCALCGNILEFVPGPLLHTTDTWEPVCNRCGHFIDPELTKLVTPQFINLHGYPHLFMGGKLYALNIQDEPLDEEEAFEKYPDEIRGAEDAESYS